MNKSFQPLTKERAMYVSELAQGCIRYIDDHMDQNIANAPTTFINVLSEIFASILYVTSEDDDDLTNSMENFLTITFKKVEILHLTEGFRNEE